MNKTAIEVIPAILRKTWEGIQEDWNKIEHAAQHVQLDVTDGIFAGDGTYRDLHQFKKLPQSDKIDLHMMVHTPSNFVDGVIDLNPSRCIFHLESFEGTNDIAFVYEKLRQHTSTQLGLALNPESPNERLEEQLSLVDFVLFMGYNPGWPNQPINEIVYTKVGQFHDKHPDTPIAVDGHVAKDTIEKYVQAGATILYSNTAIFGGSNPEENLKQLTLLAEAAQD